METPEEREWRKRKRTLKRIRIMSIVFGVAVVARVFIKNPPPPKTPDYSHYKVRYVPGMLDAIPAAERGKMDPHLLAQMIQADVEGRKGHLFTTPSTALAKPYKAAETPLDSQTASESQRQFAYSYEKRRETTVRQMEQQEVHNTNKTTVIEFVSGGFMRVENASTANHVCQIKFDRQLMATLPTKLVRNVRVDAANWTPPIPKGYIALKPARGIKIVLQQQMASRVTIPKLPMQ